MHLRTLAFACVALVALTLVALAALWLCVGWTDEGADDYAGGIVLRDSSGEILRVSLGEGDVDSRPFYRASPDDWIVRAVVASEDGAFWEHHGVRPLSVLRAAFQNVTSARRVSGASTISMQTVRLMRPHPKSLFEKAKEAIRAMKMEREKDKLWILSQYLNRAPFGANFVGIEAAAHGWFSKSAKDLGLGEAACLAGMLQAPSRFRPDRHLDEALKRRDYVLGRMLALRLITREQLEAARAVRPVVRREARPFAAPFFCDWALTLPEGARASRGKDLVTTLDADVQAFCETAVNRAAEAGGYSSAAVVLRVRDGAVIAMAASGDYFSSESGQVNTALAHRPAGSTLKPFLVAAAMDRGFVTPETRLNDLPRVYRGYRPANFDGAYRGLVTVHDALVLSLNLPFVALLERTGVRAFGTTLRALGFSDLRAGDASFGLGMAVGNVEASLLELVAASATLARGGLYLPPTAFPRAFDATRGKRVFSREAAYLVSDILSGDARSDIALGHVADAQVPRFAWKTGTSAAYRDAWTIAWNPEFVVGVWCGHKSGGFGDETLVGAKASAPVSWEIARRLYPQNRGPWFEEPTGIVHRRVCSKTGLPAARDCPKTEEGRAIRGVTPTRLCPGHMREEEPKRLQIARPEAGAEILLLAGETAQAVVLRVINNPRARTLWWFADGAFKGESVGEEPFVVDLSAGAHTLTCTTETGETASVSFVVRACL